MKPLARLIERPEGEPVVCLKETPDANVLHVFWPANANYGRAREAVDNYRENCLARAIEAPAPMMLEGPVARA